jgi:hypothetical protein
MARDMARDMNWHEIQVCLGVPNLFRPVLCYFLGTNICCYFARTKPSMYRETLLPSCIYIDILLRGAKLVQRVFSTKASQYFSYLGRTGAWSWLCSRLLRILVVDGLPVVVVGVLRREARAALITRVAVLEVVARSGLVSFVGLNPHCLRVKCAARIFSFAIPTVLAARARSSGILDPELSV